MPVIDRRFLRKLRAIGMAEGVSTLVLFFVAMPLKYVGGMPVAVTVVGSIHGVLFLTLVSMLVAAVRVVPISKGLAAAGIAGAIVPFGPFVVDRWLTALDSD